MNMCGIGATAIEEFASKFFGCGVSIVGGVALLFIIYGGVILVTSTGDPNKIRMGKEYITYAIIGLLLVIFALIIVGILGGEIFKIPGINV